jgi:protein-L-isoaspartate(D-aspartate) O-methyltransferase
MMNTTLVTRTSDTDYRTTQTWETVAPRLQNFAEPSHFKF